jgi:hypothetical protein
MAKLLCSGKEIGFTILPYLLGSSIQETLIANPSDCLVGYITNNNPKGVYKFNYIDSDTLVDNHWSLTIVNKFPYYHEEGQWIVYNCSPERTKKEFGKILTGEALHITNWDIWSVEGKESKIAVVTSWSCY